MQPDAAARAAQPRQLLVDLSVLVHQDDQTGVQRLVRRILQALRAAPPPGFRVVPVYDAGSCYAYASGGEDGGVPRPAAGADALQPLQVRAGDIFLGLDLCPDHVPGKRAVFDDLRRHGVAVYFVVYDLLPVTMPTMFSAGASPWFARWLDTVAGSADGLLCISRAVADQLLDWLEQHPATNRGPLRIGHFHPGADLDEAPGATAPLSGEEQALLDKLQGSPALLMVGTLEPRKMHAEALDAFELLWHGAGEADAAAPVLVIVGKQGWMTEQLAERLAQHHEQGKRLFWLRHASDAMLLALYRHSSALLAASSGEGFGLPLVEAARHGLPLIVRDIPVFREVCGSHAAYFSGGSAELAAALQDWLALRAAGRAPASAGMPYLSWAASAADLLRIVMQQHWYKTATTLLP
ncbi:glycosyltransferase family 4 protein [Pseudoduganella sp. UC29_71]|uniref:glycosyltransferase family 4 protein n=1 Tax=Pseudoduganella sp. UC29_71 TaxID=3350174 RepID=UPI00366D1F74